MSFLGTCKEADFMVSNRDIKAVDLIQYITAKGVVGLLGNFPQLSAASG